MRSFNDYAFSAICPCSSPPVLSALLSRYKTMYWNNLFTATNDDGVNTIRDDKVVHDVNTRGWEAECGGMEKGRKRDLHTQFNFSAMLCDFCISARAAASQNVDSQSLKLQNNALLAYRLLCRIVIHQLNRFDTHTVPWKLSIEYTYELDCLIRLSLFEIIQSLNAQNIKWILTRHKDIVAVVVDVVVVRKRPIVDWFWIGLGTTV